MKIQVRRGTAAAWVTANPTLSSGEIGFETDTGKFKFGNGVANWVALPYAADETGDIAAAIAAHVALPDPHPQYLTSAEGAAAYDTLGAAAAAQAAAATDATTKVGVETAARTAADALLIPLAQKAAASGVATLDGSGVVPLTQIDPTLKLPTFTATGLLSGGVLSIGSPTSTFTIATATGIFVDDTVPTLPVKTIVVLPAQTNIAVGAGGIGSHPVTYVGFNAAGTVIQQTAPFTPTQRRTIIELGAVIHSNLTVVNAVNQITQTTLQGTNQVWDLLYAVGPINQSGNLYSASGANLSIKRSAGVMFKAGANWANSTTDPHNVTIAASANPMTFRYRTQAGVEGADVTVLDPSKYDLNGVLTTIPGTQFSVQRVVLFSSGITRIQYGQAFYANLTDAVAGIGTENFIYETNVAENGLVRGFIVVRNNATDLTNVAQAKFVSASRINGVTSGGGGATGTDAAVAGFVADSTSATRTALSATYGSITNSTPFAPLMAALREGQDDVAIGVVGDSTGDAVDEWPYMVALSLAASFPAYTVRSRVWSDATQKFAVPVTIQTGTGGVERAVVLDSGGTVACPAYPGANLTGDLDIAVKLKAVDWSNGTQTICSKFGSSGNRSFRFQLNSSGFLIFDWSVDGANLQTAASSGVIVPHADNSIGWVRVVLDIDDGAGNHTIKFYTGSDGLAWTQLGSTVTRATGATSVFASTFDYEIGARTGQSEPLTGGARLYEVQIRDGIDGPTIAPWLATQWNRATGTGTPTIEGAPILTLVNGSHPGAALSYLNEATRYKKLTPEFGQAVVFFSDSHNEQNTVGQAWITLLSSWVTNVLARHPMAAPVLLTQNPRYSPATFIDSHARRRRQTMGWAKQRGYGVVDTYRAFIDNGGGSALINADGIHPTQTALTGGQTVWKNAITALLT